MSVVELKNADNIGKFGGKAGNLALMLQAGMPVPDGFAVGLSAFDKSGKLKTEAKQEIKKQLEQNKVYAVRSSALAEDAEGESWAGQFETFLNTQPDDVISKTEECHNSAKARARAYAKGKKNFDIAIVVQAMLKPEYAGVLFTKDPVTGADQFVIEYVKGLGEQLVSGQIDPTRLVVDSDELEAPFDVKELIRLANKVVEIFGMPQDIEWAWADNKMWLVQARPITTTQQSRKSYYLGKPDNLFYWGPSRAKPLYMHDFMEAVEQFFVSMAGDAAMPDPPKTLVLFSQGKMVWLSNAKKFSEFTKATFAAYEKRNKLPEDIKNWQKASRETSNLIPAWTHTLFAEFSLYGAESTLASRLKRFDGKIRQEIWGAFTVPDNSTFLARIDQELLTIKSPDALAKKYPWIQDGYSGVSADAESYFKKRLKILKDNSDAGIETKKDRTKLAKELGLSAKEINALNLTRGLAEFMDDRKAWMMQTRHHINGTPKFQYGWLFNEGKSSALSEDVANELWERYVEFKASSTTVMGIVASNGGRHFINGKVKVVGSPTDSVEDDRILVVPSTSPSYVPLMRKARALITDHGGMMSHAAIVAREFGLPCIVGTKQATKVLKDGDKVVLDLVKGEVNR